MTLYCLSKPDSSLNGSNTWLFKNVTIDQVSHSNHYDIVDEGRVLVIRSVSMETSGVYSCRTTSGEEYSAFVEVLGELAIRSHFVTIFLRCNVCILNTIFKFNSKVIIAL